MPGLTRWYDPYIAHFAQADSVLDNPITGWDRYSYVRNSPVNYTDPSGNRCVDDEGGCDSRVIFYQQATQGEPDGINENLLSARAKDLYALYRRMYADKTGWWWDEYGEGGFTIWEFLAIQWGLEQHYYPKTSKYAEAVKNAAASWCSGQPGCDMKTAEWNLNFFAAYTHRPFEGTTTCTNDPDCDIKTVSPRPPLNDSMRIVGAIYNRGSILDKPIGPNDPFEVGNVSLSNKILSKMIRWGMAYASWGSGDTFFILTKCQSDYYYSAKNGNGVRDINYRTYSCGG